MLSRTQAISPSKLLEKKLVLDSLNSAYDLGLCLPRMYALVIGCLYAFLISFGSSLIQLLYVYLDYEHR